MKIFLVTPGPYGAFANFAAVGTWTDGKVCVRCTGTNSHLVAPLLIEWEPGSDVIADFSWDGGYICVPKDEVVSQLIRHGFDFESLPVRYVAESRVPKRKKIVKLPYIGPEQKWILAKRTVALNEKASGVRLEDACSVCGRIEMTFRRDGIAIDRRDWDGSVCFKIQQNGRSDAMFVTEEGKARMESQSWSNIGFLPAGEIC